MAFSLIEVTLALAVASFTLVAILGLIPVGLSSMRESVDDTVTCFIREDSRAALIGLPFREDTLPPFYYDRRGLHLGDSPSTNSFYRVDISLAPPETSPPSSDLLVAVVTIRWPVSETGLLLPNAKEMKFSQYVCPLTGPEWTDEDTSRFIPKIEL